MPSWMLTWLRQTPSPTTEGPSPETLWKLVCGARKLNMEKV